MQSLPADNNALYAAFLAKDTRFDGRFFVGISSTGIYCRPVCRAKRPKPENCSFFATAAQAEQAGYRPCLLCRPERAPGAACAPCAADASLALANRAARLLEESCGSGQSLDALAEKLGCTARHLRRVFVAEYQVSPVQYLQTCRLLLAKNLLTDTRLPVLEVAMAAGFGSLRRFNSLFKQHYHLAPSALRKRQAGTGASAPLAAAGASPAAGAGANPQQGAICLALGYRPPYPWQQMLHFLAVRAIPGVEAVCDGHYLRTVRLETPQKQVQGWVRVGHSPQNHTLAVTIAEELLPVLPQVLARVRHLFDLDCDPDTVYEALAGMNKLRPGLCVLGARLPGCFDSFEMAVRAVLGQQVTIQAARTLAARLVAAHGTPVQTGIAGLTHIFPSPQTILDFSGPVESHLGPLGIIAARAKTIQALAQALAQGSIQLGLCASPEAEMEKLMAIRGIGRWTAQYIAMRAMQWPDAFLDTDAGVKKALRPYATDLLALSQAWRPWRSYATVNLWNSLAHPG